jgi:hypothetical protein
VGQAGRGKCRREGVRRLHGSSQNRCPQHVEIALLTPPCSNGWKHLLQCRLASMLRGARRGAAGKKLKGMR